jgi:hypothetical protein
VQSLQATTFPSCSLGNQTYDWACNLAPDVQRRQTTTGWSATAVWGAAGPTSPVGYIARKPAWITQQVGESPFGLGC